MTILIYDSSRNEQRSFKVVPDDKNFKVRCSVDIHQGYIFDKFCSCGKYKLESYKDKEKSI